MLRLLVFAILPLFTQFGQSALASGALQLGHSDALWAALCRGAEYSTPRISPDGRSIAYQVHDELGRTQIWLSSLDDADASQLTDFRSTSNRQMYWSGDGKYLIYTEDRLGNEQWHIRAIDLASGSDTDLTPIDGVSADIIDLSGRSSTDLLVELTGGEISGGIYRIDIESGTRGLDTANTMRGYDWRTDAAGTVRVVASALPDGGSQLLLRANEKSPWETVRTWQPDEWGKPLILSASRTLLYASNHDSPRSRLVVRDIETQRETTIPGQAVADAEDIFIHRGTIAIPYIADRKFWWFVGSNSLVAQAMQPLLGIGPGEFTIVSRAQSASLWIVAYREDRVPTRYYLYNVDTSEIRPLFSAYPPLDGVELATTESIRFSARDGVTIQGYLTRPLNNRGGPIPLVLLVHGGLHGRDYWGFDSRVQWLVSQGYAVLQVNFRGSSGFGKDFQNAGVRGWGGVMQDDLTDGVRWAIEQGIADPQRIAIMGGSYGGYAALMGAATTPELYAAAIAFNAPSHLVSYLEAIPLQGTPWEYSFHRIVGHPERDRDFLEARSPVNLAANVRVPVLLANGANDSRVPASQGEMMAESLSQAGRDVEHVIYHDEGHGFFTPANRADFYSRVDRILKRTIGANDPVSKETTLAAIP